MGSNGKEIKKEIVLGSGEKRKRSEANNYGDSSNPISVDSDEDLNKSKVSRSGEKIPGNEQDKGKEKIITISNSSDSEEDCLITSVKRDMGTFPSLLYNNNLVGGGSFDTKVGGGSTSTADLGKLHFDLDWSLFDLFCDARTENVDVPTRGNNEDDATSDIVDDNEVLRFSGSESGED